MSNVIQTLRERGLFEAITDEAFAARTERESVTIYCGFDPTASSLHVGSLLPIIGLRHLQLAGHTPIPVVGGGTGMIGDPSGKRAERTLMTLDQVRANADGIREQLGRFLNFSGPNAARMRNNADWLTQMSFIEFLRDVGKYFRLSDMLEKESVRSRQESEVGISFTEFSYMLLQAYDFAWLYKNEGCIAQCGGSDQWGNITAGTDLIRKLHAGQAYGVTFPLLMTASGQKFGKSESGTVWLDAARTSPYDFYQFWIRSEDADAERLLKLFTFLPLDEIASIVAEHRSAPEKRLAQKRLAAEVTTMVHGSDEARKAEEAAAALFGGSITNVAGVSLRDIAPDAPTVQLPRAGLAAGIPFLDLLVSSGLCASKSEARRLVEQGGAYLNQQVIRDLRHPVGESDLSADGAVLLRAGKKNYRLVSFT